MSGLDVCKTQQATVTVDTPAQKPKREPAGPGNGQVASRQTVEPVDADPDGQDALATTLLGLLGTDGPPPPPSLGMNEALSEVMPHPSSPAQGWWPQAGLLRVAAHACGSGKVEDLARALESLDDLRDTVGFGVEAFDGVVDDANGGNESAY